MLLFGLAFQKLLLKMNQARIFEKNTRDALFENLAKSFSVEFAVKAS